MKKIYIVLNVIAFLWMSGGYIRTDGKAVILK